MNPEVIKTLPTIQRVKATYAGISRLDGKGSWKFLLQPTEINYETAANYATANSPATEMQFVQWRNNENLTLSINNLPISGRSIISPANKNDEPARRQARLIEKYIDELAAFLKPVEKGKAPPVLAFVWGARSHSPCVMTRFQRTEQDWYPDGSLAGCLISFTLLRVPLDQLIQ
jgi:hypothetical protein